MKDYYISGVVDMDQHTVDLNALVTTIQDLKWNYFEKYHKEPKYIKMPVWLVVLLQHHCMQLIGFDDNAITYLGFKVCETYSIDNINQIEVF